MVRVFNAEYSKLMLLYIQLNLLAICLISSILKVFILDFFFKILS